MEVKSEIDRGTTLRIFLPVSLEITSFDQVVNTEDMIRGRERILLVDDEK
jgi:hypothetical protein